MADHVMVTTPEGWIDCSCGWKSNHPLIESEEALTAARAADPDFVGTPDPDHTGRPSAANWTAHVAAVTTAMEA